MSERSRLMYLRDSNRNPIGCVAMRYEPTTGGIEFQVSVANPKDPFSKKVAKEIASGRLFINPFRTSTDINASVHEVSKAVMTEIANSSLAVQKGTKAKFPFVAVKFARYWLQDSSALDKIRRDHGVY